MSTTQAQQTDLESVAVAAYEAPAITTLGTLAELTLTECYPLGAYKNQHKADFANSCAGSH